MDMLSANRVFSLGYSISGIALFFLTESLFCKKKMSVIIINSILQGTWTLSSVFIVARGCKIGRTMTYLGVSMRDGRLTVPFFLTSRGKNLFVWNS